MARRRPPRNDEHHHHIQRRPEHRYQDSYGAPRGTAPTNWPSERGFQNGDNDPSGLVRIGAREYDAALGRFISDDPISRIENSQRLQGYAYALNSPLTFADPSGSDAQNPETEHGSWGPGGGGNCSDFWKQMLNGQCPPGEQPTGLGGKPGGDKGGPDCGDCPIQINFVLPEPEPDTGCWGDFMGDWTCKAAAATNEWLADNSATVGLIVAGLSTWMCLELVAGATAGIGAVAAGGICGAIGGFIGEGVASYLAGDASGEIATAALQGALLGALGGMLVPGIGKLLSGGSLIPSTIAKGASPPPGWPTSALTGMNKGGGHAMSRFVSQYGYIPNSGSLASKKALFDELVTPILKNPWAIRDGHLAGTAGHAYVGFIEGRMVAVFVASEGPYAGKVISAFQVNNIQVNSWF